MAFGEKWFFILSHSLQMKLVYLSSEAYQSRVYTLWILEFKKKWQSDLPAWKVIYILDGAMWHWKHTHLLSWWAPAHSHCWDTDGSWRCMACPSLQRQIRPSRKVLLLYHHVPFCTLSCLAELMLKSQWKGKGLCNDHHFPSSVCSLL